MAGTLIDPKALRRQGRAPTRSVRGIAKQLESALRGEVRFDEGSRALYATDASNYRQVPIGVVVPRDGDDVIRATAICREHGVPILARGGGTSLAGQCCNVAVVLDTSKYMNRVLWIDVERRLARVEPGTILDTLRDQAERAHLTFGPDPATHNHCTLGGMIGNNSCGTHSVMAGRTSENVESLDILTYEGLRLEVGATSDGDLAAIRAAGGRRAEIYARLRSLGDRYADLIRRKFPRIPRRVSGYGLDQLLPENGFQVARALTGTESTCAIVLAATLRLVRSPPQKTLLVLGYPDIYSAADEVTKLLEHGPIALEGLDHHLVGGMGKKGLHTREAKLLPEGRGWLLVEFGADTAHDALERAHAAMKMLSRGARPPTMKLFEDPVEQKAIWAVRESGLGATARVPGEKDTWEGWEDSAVAPENLGGYLRGLRKLLGEYGYACALYGHFGQGCVHTRIDFDLKTREGIARFRSFVEAAADLVVKHGGSFSGEHGDGQSRAELLPKMYGPELVHAFEEFKDIWDPEGKMNPGKVVRPYRLDENLRLGDRYDPTEPTTHFQFPDDDGSFAYAMERCVGVGECRRLDGGTMCPSFMATREEMHSTRGRARLLFEMLQGEPLRAGWSDEHVRESLDLCLACKGCKGECPVNVDMATYKAEFLSHYYETHGRPRSAYAFGLIDLWARAASTAPHLVNFVTQTPGLSSLAKRVAEVAPERRIPKFAAETFRGWYRRQHRRLPGGVEHQRGPVILWVDTFNNHFHPEVCVAALEVLEQAGFGVIVHDEPLCCGRPLYDYGMLGRAKRLLGSILEVLGPSIEAGIPVVGLEPSCVAVFRDELVGLFPRNPNARRLSGQVFLLSELLEKHAGSWRPPRLQGRALVHGHCHHKSILDMESELVQLRKMGLEVELVDSGCCGMAGAFGFEKEHYDVSMRIGERVLLPAIRGAGASTLVIASGFSCREQIAQGSSRHALHFAEVLQQALRSTSGPTLGKRTHARLSPVEKAMLAGGFIAIGVLAWRTRFWARIRCQRAEAQKGSLGARVIWETQRPLVAVGDLRQMSLAHSSSFVHEELSMSFGSHVPAAEHLSVGLQGKLSLHIAPSKLLAMQYFWIPQW